MPCQAKRIEPLCVREDGDHIRLVGSAAKEEVAGVMQARKPVVPTKKERICVFSWKDQSVFSPKLFAGNPVAGRF